MQSCYKDDTSTANREISTIQVNLGFPEKATIDLGLNEEYTLKPDVEQKDDLPLTYEWEVDYKVVSIEKNFSFKSPRLGSYPVRLKVSNTDGSVFKEFKIRVNSQYEEGLLILAEDANKEGTLSFIPKKEGQFLSLTDKANVDINSFEKSNPGDKIGKSPTDIAVRENQIFVSSEEGKISAMNYKTLELEAVIESPDFPDFKPVFMNIPDNASKSSLILNKSGKIYNLATLEHVVSNNSTAGTKVFELKTQMLPTQNYTSGFFWEPATSIFHNLWTRNANTGTRFNNQNMIQFFAYGDYCYTLTSSKSDPSIIKRSVFSESRLTFIEESTFTNTNMTLKPDSKTLLIGELSYLAYTNGRSIYKWYYTTNNIPSTPYITLDIAGVITSMARTPAKEVGKDDLDPIKELYVAVYDENATGLKGSVVVYDLETGAKKATFANIADKPVKIFFKKRK
ncbi:PKD-like domain-containing protein [Sphingobacterium bovistauri]|uniref:PKD domain-containing protein n=1 Tax=Sphingobacterium bovistauri TaxID=2781959 RepID=A0ABS7Z6H7_9SPHI|nr:PKD-like domain-containing protein [Sphingobacterium bovistauri]MCA5004319.1 PKD domain-containing protein [Sphingobacterium bovistauri]